MCGCILGLPFLGHCDLDYDQISRIIMTGSYPILFEVGIKKIAIILTLNLNPMGGVKRSKQFFSESSQVAYQMNRKVGRAHTMVIYTMGGLGGVGFLL